MPAGRPSHIRRMTAWLPDGMAGLFRVTCSCGAWKADGTVAQVNAASGAHDDSPFSKHVVRIVGEITVRMASLWSNRLFTR